MIAYNEKEKCRNLLLDLVIKARSLFRVRLLEKECKCILNAMIQTLGFSINMRLISKCNKNI